MLKFVAAIIAFALFIQTGSAVKCYACTSLTHGESCADPFNASGENIPTCELTLGDEPICVKAITTVPLGNDVAPLRTVHRVCQLKSVDFCGKFASTIGVSGVLDHCSSCQGDFCNSGPKSVTASLSALLLVVAASLRQIFFA